MAPMTEDAAPAFHLKRAHQLHAEGRIDAAIAEARAGLDMDAAYVDALTYLGTTLMSGRPIEPGFAERLHVELGRLGGVRAAADRLDDRVLLVRLLSGSGAAFHGARRWIRDCSASF